MIDEKISSLQLILKGILNPDNKTRNDAVAQLDELRKTPNTLIICLVKILNGKKQSIFILILK